jgi:probable lipoprotein NlpC
MHVGFYDTEHLPARLQQPGRYALFAGQPLLELGVLPGASPAEEYNAQITMNNDNLHLAKNH